MTNRAPRHHAMVDFQQHCERRWVVLEEDHLKVEQENARLRAEVDELADAAREKEKDYFQLQSEAQNLRAEVEARRKDAERYRFVRELAWYVDQAAYIYDIGNTRSPWPGERAPVDADDVEAAIDEAMAQQGQEVGNDM